MHANICGHTDASWFGGSNCYSSCVCHWLFPQITQIYSPTNDKPIFPAQCSQACYQLFQVIYSQCLSATDLSTLPDATRFYQTCAATNAAPQALCTITERQLVNMSTCLFKLWCCFICNLHLEFVYINPTLQGSQCFQAPTSANQYTGVSMVPTPTGMAPPQCSLSCVSPFTSYMQQCVDTAIVPAQTQQVCG